MDFNDDQVPQNGVCVPTPGVCPKMVKDTQRYRINMSNLSRIMLSFELNAK